MFSVSNSESVPFLRWLCGTLSAECITISSCLCRDCHSSLSNRHHISQNCPIVMINFELFITIRYVLSLSYSNLVAWSEVEYMYNPTFRYPWTFRGYRGVPVYFCHLHEIVITAFWLNELLITCLYFVSIPDVYCQCLYTVSTIPNTKDAAYD